MKLINYSLVCGQISLIVAMLVIKPVIAESTNKDLARSPAPNTTQLLKSRSVNNSNYQQVSKNKLTISLTLRRPIRTGILGSATHRNSTGLLQPS